ncbi:MAG: erythromycin esterase family protein, partial [Gemmatimonadota bacterium]
STHLQARIIVRPFPSPSSFGALRQLSERGVITIAVSFVLASVSQAQSVPVSAIRRLDLRHPAEYPLAAGESHSYVVSMRAGTVLLATVDQRGIDVIVHLVAPDGKKLEDIDSPNGRKGPEPIVLHAAVKGEYRIEVAPFEGDTSSGGRYGISVEAVVTARQYAARLEAACAAARAQRVAVVAWLKEDAIPLTGALPGTDLGDIAPFKSALLGVDIVGLGEASHGSRELFQLKTRMVEFLVRQMGFRVLALELDYVASLRIDTYVRGVSVDTAFLLKPWDTEEFTGMLAWLRAYNAMVPDSEKVSVTGIDGQDRVTGRAELLEYLKRVAPEQVAHVDSLFSDSTFPARLEPARANDLQRQYADLFAFMDLNGARFIPGSSRAEYESAREIARMLLQPGYIYAGTDMSGVTRRDEFMADNFRRLVDRSRPGTRFILWAHNAHVESSTNGFPRMGSFLRQLYGHRYYALGSTFEDGEFQAWDEKRTAAGKFVLKSYQAPPAPEESTEWYLSQAGRDMLLIDFRAASTKDAAREWLAKPRLTRVIGAVFSLGMMGGGYGGAERLHDQFDGMLFTVKSSRARPTRRMMDQYQDLQAPITSTGDQ